MVIVPVELGNDQNIAGLQLLHEPAKHWDQATAMPDDERVWVPQAKDVWFSPAFWRCFATPTDRSQIAGSSRMVS